MIIDSLETGPLQVNCYIVGCEATRKAAVIDPGGDAELILERLQKHNLKLQMVVNTHGHFDHVGGNKRLLEATGVELLIHVDDKDLLGMAAEHAGIYGLPTELSPAPDKLLADGDLIKLGDLELKVLHTPGHTPGGICLLVEDLVVVGDTLFAGSIGRTDLPGGNHEQLITSIHKKLLPLPESTAVYPGHGPSSSIGREKASNPFLS